MSDTGQTSATVRRRRWIACAAIFLVALGVRLVYLHQLQSTPFHDEQLLLADARYYDTRATEILAGDWVPEVPGFLSPFYCYFLAGVYALVGKGTAVKVVHVVIGALTCVLLYPIGRRLWSDGVGLLAAGMLSFYGLHVYYHGLMLPTTVIVFLHVLLVWLLVGGWSRWRFVVAGVLIGWAIAAKANAVLLLPVLGLWLWLAPKDRRTGDRLRAVALLAAGTVAGIGPFTAMNYAASGTFVLATTTGGANLVKGNGPTADGTHAFLPAGTRALGIPAHRQHRVTSEEVIRESRRLSAEAWDYMRRHKKRTVLLWGKKLMLMFNHRELGIRDLYYFTQRHVPLLRWPLVAFWMVAPIGMTGLVLSWRRWRHVGVLYAVMAAQVASFVLIFVLARYRLVFIACLLPFAAAQILAWVEAARGRRWRPFAVSLPVLALWTAIVFWPFPEFPRDRGFADQYSFVGQYWAKQGDPARAAENYQAAIEADWSDPRRVDGSVREHRVRLARAWIKLGRIDAARTELTRVAAELEQLFPGQDTAAKQEVRELLERIEPSSGAGLGP